LFIGEYPKIFGEFATDAVESIVGMDRSNAHQTCNALDQQGTKPQANHAI
jgi:hypothetical protein